MRTHDAVDADLGLDLHLQRVSLGTTEHRPDADAGQSALVGADRLGECTEPGGAYLVAQRGGILRLAEGGQL